MVQDETGFGDDLSEAAIELLIGGGCDVHLLGTEAEATDSVADVESKAVATTSAAESDFTIDKKAAFSDTTELLADDRISWGEVNEGVIKQIALTGSGFKIVGKELDQPDTTGEEVFIPDGETLYEHGNVE